MPSEANIPAMPPPATCAPRPRRGLFAAVVAVAIVLGATWVQTYRGTQRQDKAIDRAIYTADDAYAQLAIAYALNKPPPDGASSESGAGGPLAASSSPGWSYVLAATLKMRQKPGHPAEPVAAFVMVPLVLNYAAAALLILLAGHLLSRDVLCSGTMFVALLAMAAFAPLPNAIAAGTGGVLHAVSVLAATAMTLAMIERERFSVLGAVLAAVLMAAAVLMSYASLAVLAGLLFWSIARRRWGRVLLPLLAAALMVIWIGMTVSRAGGNWVPNPVLLALPEGMLASWRSCAGGFVRHLVHQWAFSASIVLMLMAAGLLAWHARGAGDADRHGRESVGWLVVLLVAGILFGGVAPEATSHAAAWLIALGMVAVVKGIAAGKQFPPADAKARGVLVGVLAWVPLFLAGMAAVYAAVDLPRAFRRAQVSGGMTTRFVRTLYPEGPVATATPGQVAVQTDAKVVDLTGAWDAGMAMAWAKGTMERELLTRAAMDNTVRVAIVGPRARWLPKAWRAAGQWWTKTGCACACPLNLASAAPPTMTVYAPTPRLANDVRLALEQFADPVDFHWPEDVQFTINQSGAEEPAPATNEASPDGGSGGQP